MQNVEMQYPIAPKTAKGFAVTALVLGIIAITTAWVPYLGIAISVLAVVFGIIALRKRQPKGLGLTGLILGAIAMLTAVTVTVTVTLFAGNLFSELEKLDASAQPLESHQDGEPDTHLDSERGDREVEPADVIEDETHSETPPAEDNMETPVPWDALDTADAPESTSAGTADDPHQIGSRIIGEGLEIVVNSVDSDAFDKILALAPDNEPPAEHQRYVLVHMTIKSTGSEPLEATKIKFAYDTPNQRFPHRDRYLTSYPEPRLLAPNQQITGNFSGYITFRINQRVGQYLEIEHQGFPEKQHVALP